MRHPQVMKWEARLKQVFDEIDHFLEEKYGGQYPLHPARQEVGTAANPEEDGLFDVGAAFTAGFGSEYGPGYVVEIRMATLNAVPRDVYQQIETEVVALLGAKLPQAFPGQPLTVVKDGPVIKIRGDLSLGQL